MRPDRASVAILFDVDDTLFDNDAFERAVHTWLEHELGLGCGDRYRQAFEARRKACDYADFLGAVQGAWEASGRDPRWLQVGDFLLDYPFRQHLYPGALDALARLAQAGVTWLITDGDGVMQPRKLRGAGLWDAVGGRVRIYVHKERQLSDIRRACGADHYAMVDDKPRILDAVKRGWRNRVTTVQPLQGHYALAAAGAADHLPPDVTVKHIGLLAERDNALVQTLRTL
jgi:phosphoglycolate phosphatase-like HAD superfamily hydrolase